jgi:Spy/CpxP family protein refolding chaperone
MRKPIALMLFAAACALAQSPDQFAWWDSPLVQDLNLTMDQQKQIRSVVREHRDQLIEQRAAVQKAEGNLMDLMNEDKVDEAKARDAVDKVVAARADLMRTVSQMAVRLRAVLTPQQWQMVQKRRLGQAMQRRQLLRRQAPPAAPQPPPPPAAQGPAPQAAPQPAPPARPRRVVPD